jgi:hypothetical protein
MQRLTATLSIGKIPATVVRTKAASFCATLLHPLPGSHICCHTSFIKQPVLAPHLCILFREATSAATPFFEAPSFCITPLDPLPRSHICCHTFLPKSRFLRHTFYALLSR